jgi:hypothetical protein
MSPSDNATRRHRRSGFHRSKARLPPLECVEADGDFLEHDLPL